ncbi:MAG: hypothetical protein IJW02_06785 [Clostridia bacterium]|nr:hypothetical protein [Clostridia bacterium]
MKKLGNFLWCVLGGFLFAAVYFLLGVVLCVTIVGIPFAKQDFKLAKLVFKPFNKNIVFVRKRPVLNVLWNLCGGIVLAAFYFVLSVVLCVTLVGIPFGKQCFKLAKLSFKPFGRTVA